MKRTYKGLSTAIRVLEREIVLQKKEEAKHMHTEKGFQLGCRIDRMQSAKRVLKRLAK